MVDISVQLDTTPVLLHKERLFDVLHVLLLIFFKLFLLKVEDMVLGVVADVVEWKVGIGFCVLWCLIP